MSEPFGPSSFGDEANRHETKGSATARGEQLRELQKVAADDRRRKLEARTWNYATIEFIGDPDGLAQVLTEMDELGWEYYRMEHVIEMQHPGIIGVLLGRSHTTISRNVLVFRTPFVR